MSGAANEIEVLRTFPRHHCLFALENLNKHTNEKSIDFAASTFMVACGGGSQQEAVETTEEQDLPVVEASVIYEVEEGSTLNWRGFKTHVPDDHTGTIKIAGGEINMEGENMVAGSFHVDMNSIALTDALKDNEEKIQVPDRSFDERRLLCCGFFPNGHIRYHAC